MKLEAALQQLKVGRKAKRLRNLWPTIEEKLAEGVSHAEILGLRNENGFAPTERTYKSYLYRYRNQPAHISMINRRYRPDPAPFPARRLLFPITESSRGSPLSSRLTALNHTNVCAHRRAPAMHERGAMLIARPCGARC
jgi:hypothetical protein